MQPIQWKSTKYAQILTNPVFYTQKVLFSMHCMQLVAKYALLVKLKPILCKSLQKLENVWKTWNPCIIQSIKHERKQNQLKSKNIKDTQTLK